MSSEPIVFNTSASGLPTWRKYICLAHFVENMRVREKRRVFHLMRTENVDADMFMPGLALFVSEFATFQVLADSNRRLGRS